MEAWSWNNVADYELWNAGHNTKLAVYFRRYSNLIAMAELLASDAKAKTVAFLKAEREGKWVMKRESNLAGALSRIIESRRIRSHQSQIANNHSHYSSYISDGGSSAQRSESAPAVVAENSLLSLGSQRKDIFNIKRDRNSVHPISVLKATQSKSLPRYTANRTKNSETTSTSRLTSRGQKQALLKLPKFSKNSFSSNLDPNFGALNSEWINSFAEASAVLPNSEM